MARYFLLVVTVFVQLVCFGQNSAEIKKIFSGKCATCHAPGMGAPFSLQTYDDIKKRLATIKNVVETGYMPPWRPDAHYRDFANNRSLTSNERSQLLQWIGNNAPGWENTKETAAPKSTDNFLNATPDLILKIDSPFIVKGDNTEKFILFKVPFETKEAGNIEAVEFYSNNKKIVHHINYGFYDVPDKSVDIYSGPKVINTDADTFDQATDQYKAFKKKVTYYSGWIPGTTYEYYPKQFGWKLPTRGVLILTAHYSAIAANEKSIVGVKLFFKKQPIEREVRIISFGSGGIGEQDITPSMVIAPNKVSKFSLKVQTQEAQSIMYVWPHMHYIGKEFLAYAVTPTNDTINLVHIPDWDFKWQELYRFKSLIKIPAKSVINMVGTYDNTATNPSNQFSPPRFIYSSGNMNAQDEMFTMLMIYVPYNEGDEKLNVD